MNLVKFGSWAAATALIASLGACDNGPSAVRTRDRDSGLATYQNGGVYSASYSSSADAGDGPRADRSYRARRSGSDGDGWWASSRTHSAAESADYHFKRDGADFGASSVNDYVAKAHAFVGHPPRGTLTLERRNGDVLLYDPKANVFAVKTKDGAPRTMFKPRDGRAYWEQQIARENNRRGQGSANDDQRS
jgi:hypothetical protein